MSFTISPSPVREPSTLGISNVTITLNRSIIGAEETVYLYFDNSLGDRFFGTTATTNAADFDGIDGGFGIGYFTFQANESSITFRVPINGDNVAEGTETFYLEVDGNSPNFSGGGLQGDYYDYQSPDGSFELIRATLADPDIAATPAAAASNPGITEGERDNSGSQIATAVTVTLTRAAGQAGDLTYTYATTDGTARSTATGLDPADYTAKTGSVTIAAGSNSATVSVNVLGDFRAEGNETFSVVFTPATGTPGSAVTSTVTIQDDGDVAQGGFYFTSTGATEGDTALTAVSITGTNIDNTSGNGAVYGLRIVEGAPAGTASATAGIDFDSFNAGINGAPNNGSLQYVYSVVRGDYLIEPTEAFAFALDRQNGAAKLATSTQYVTITDNDSAGTFSAADVSVTEGDTLSQTGQFTVTRTGSGLASVPYTIANGGSSNVAVAQAGIDYTASSSGTINFAGGQTSAIVQFTIIGDTLVEGNEQFKLTLGTPSDGGSIARQIGIATIIDNDVPAGSTAQQGTPGNDTLIAQGPNSVLIGGTGNDTFLVHAMGDVVVENNGGGTDIVYTDVSYNLGSNEVEALSVANQMTTTDINLIGNFVSQTIVGNYGNNILNGGSGADTLIGLFGSDTYAIGDSRIVIQEQAGQGNDIVVTSVDYTLGAGVSIETFAVQDRASTAAINLTGNEIAQTIVGSEGANVINGGAGSDTLIGFGGADTFAFTTALGTTNVDTIVDFTAGTDRIALGSSIFAAIGTTLDASEFVTGTAAATASQFIVYNASTGALFYDADGSGAGAAVQFAAIAPNTALTTAMFTVV